MPLNVDKLDAGIVNQSGNPVKPYKVYSALLTQSGTDAPVATVLENTLGCDIIYSYSSTGIYLINSSEDIFDNSKFIVIQGAGNSSSLVSIWVYSNSLTELVLECYDLGNVNIPFETKNNILINQFIEIRVYN